MHFVTSFAIAAFMLVTMTASAAQAPATALCDRMVEQIRSAPQDDPFSILTKGAHPFIEIDGESERKEAGLDDAANDAEIVNRFITKFNPSPALLKAWTDNFALGHVEIGRLAGSDLHMITITGGSALCHGFIFFQTPKGRQAQVLPDLPLKGDRDGDNIVCSKYGHEGYLVRVGGAEAYLETYGDEKKSSFRVVPLRDGKWANACVVEAEYKLGYKTSKAFVPAKGPLAEADLKTLASQLVERREAVKEAKDFSFGPPLSESEKEEVRKMAELVEKLDAEPVPAFGRESELAAGEETFRSGDSFPLVYNGRAYLLRLGEGQLGCCYSTGPFVILYTLKDGKLDPVGSAVVEKGRGALESIRAAASR